MDPLIGTIMLAAFPFAPKGWMFCNGQILNIQTYPALYALLGVQFGGDGRTTFALPDLRGRLPIGMGQGPGLSPRPLGQQTGVEKVTLTGAQVPAHTHAFAVGGDASASSPQGAVPATVAGFKLYASSATPGAYLAPATVQATGAGEPHNNVMPSLALGFIICLEGSYPPLD